MRIPHFFLAALLFAGFPVVTFASFSDVPSTHPNADAIQYVQEQSIVSGYADGTFRPDNSINRAEFTKFIVLANYDKSLWNFNSCPDPFPDVPGLSWFTPYICNAKSQYIVSGYPDGTFKPAANIAFVEAAKILSKTLGNMALAPESSQPWYKFYVDDLAARNDIPLSITRFDQPLTRGEMAEMIWRIKTNRRDLLSQTYTSLSGNAKQTDTITGRTYTNARLGFSLDLPGSTSIGLGLNAPVIVVDNGSADHVYIVPERYIPIAQRSPSPIPSWDALEAMESSAVPGWKITVAPADSLGAAGRFIRSQFGSRCTLVALMPTEYEGTMDVTLGGINLAQGTAQDNCWVNYKYSLKYSPSLHLIASWDLEEKPIPWATADSFRFIQ